jgi:2-polyprenyl-6-methoxyphenol hydroxylase-like FAD-dependent oxidoreductase
VFWSMPRAELEVWGLRDLADWQAEVAALWPEMAAFTDQVTHMTPARYSHGTLGRPFAPGLAFIGDAAHRASPQLGQGANMALLDAMALTLALRDGPADALPRYAHMRRWHVRSYQIMSAVFTPMYQSSSRILPRLRDHVMAPAGQLRPVQAMLSRLVAGTLIPPLASQVWPGQDAGQTPQQG